MGNTPSQDVPANGESTPQPQVGWSWAVGLTFLAGPPGVYSMQLGFSGCGVCKAVTGRAGGRAAHSCGPPARSTRRGTDRRPLAWPCVRRAAACGCSSIWRAAGRAAGSRCRRQPSWTCTTRTRTPPASRPPGTSRWTARRRRSGAARAWRHSTSRQGAWQASRRAGGRAVYVGVFAQQAAGAPPRAGPLCPAGPRSQRPAAPAPPQHCGGRPVLVRAQGEPRDVCGWGGRVGAALPHAARL